ncbi:Lactose permease [Drechslerella dactyloides]|uniref:Lactose permease n=1 Tax=Drechslerella dactyloides TaxID=74499 RepID=A0AAD6IYI8_DREDA|nr:Lactose permease [Drechslerella dactyloides]
MPPDGITGFYFWYVNKAFFEPEEATALIEGPLRCIHDIAFVIWWPEKWAKQEPVNMAHFERKYVSELVPANTKVLTVLLVAVTIVNSATFGYDASVMNGLAILPSYTEYFHLTDATIGLNNAAVWIGSILGTGFAQPIPDRLGRKNGILLATVITAVGIILQASAQNIPMFVVGRMIIGGGTTVSNLSATPLLAELLPPRSRSFILGIFFSCFYVGGLLSAIINYGSQNIQSTWAWRLPSLLQIIPSVVSIAFLPFIPESPRWLIANGHEEHATEVLAIVGGERDNPLQNAAESMQDIKSIMAKEEEMYPKGPWKELLSTPANRKRVFLLVLFGIMIEMMGNFIVSYYLGKFLTQAGITDTNKQNQINTLIGVAGMTASLYTLGGLIKVYGDSSNTSAVYGTIAVIFLFQGFYAFSITPMTSLYPTEICQYKLRAAGSAVFRFVDSGFGLLASFTMSFALSDLGWKFYLINASWNLMFLALVYLFFVETKGLKLEEIALLFGEDVIDGSENPHVEYVDVAKNFDDGSVPERGSPSTSRLE